MAVKEITNDIEKDTKNHQRKFVIVPDVLDFFSEFHKAFHPLFKKFLNRRNSPAFLHTESEYWKEDKNTGKHRDLLRK